MTTPVQPAPAAVSQTAAAAPASPAAIGASAIWRVEVVKLSSQLRVRVALALCLLGPVVFAVAESVQSAVPADTLFGRWVHESGFAFALLVLGFAGQWGLPVLVAVVAGDICAEEDRHRTWSLILTRSAERSSVLTGKLLAAATYTVAITVALAASAIITGLVSVGDQPLVGLSGALLSPGAALTATVGSWAVVLAPALAFAAIAFLASVLSRNSWVGTLVPVVIVLVLNLVSLISAVDPVRPLLPTTGFEAWHGLARDDVYTNQVWIAVLASAVWIAACTAVATWVFLRRDVVES